MELREALAWCKEVELISAGSAVSNHAPFVFARHFVVPSVFEVNWQASLQAIIAGQKITHIFPAHDDALIALVENAKCFAAKIVTSPLETCRITRSKLLTMKHLDGIIPTPRLFTNAEDVAEFPVFVKPDRSQGAQGTACARSRSELLDLLKRDGARLILENLPGEEFTVDCFSDRENGLLFASGRSRIRIKSGIAMSSRIIDDLVFQDYARRINEILPLQGAWFFQVKYDQHGVLKLLEVAPRIGGTSALSRVRGVNLPLLSLYESDRLPVQITPAHYSVEIDRALRNRYVHDIDYRTLYVDFDDTLVTHGRVNFDLVKLLYQALHRGVRLVLLTRHAGDLPTALGRYRLAGIFDEIIHLRAAESKADFIHDPRAVFIDDSYAERSLVHKRTGVPVFAPCMIDMLLDERL
jgi:carbamoyl-phosphate synthase large subunit